ncbi:hypothetical protein GCM10010080_11310 [Thermomonas carbonis]|uniref:Uncharacterized protein n=2 Tax=Thermomonas carbonis TaxID=1463158 RepID=A0A7G9SUG9_9GAMM|nr:hypothetical protein [Thermomonas carbonis]QNN71494.1 hypothetical protein H9L16_02050 [Thermomonas carbonis]GHC00006.1 hypothetical protein GCM10010080_11310 [Thermomonas carbonis]
MSIFRNTLFNRVRFATFGAPRRPRHPFLRIALGLVGVALLLALLFVSVFVGIAMLAVGMLYRLMKQRRTPMAAHARSIDGDYRVVGKAQLPLAH